jgi:hypothetical protein
MTVRQHVQKRRWNGLRDIGDEGFQLIISGARGGIGTLQWSRQPRWSEAWGCVTVGQQMSHPEIPKFQDVNRKKNLNNDFP